MTDIDRISRDRITNNIHENYFVEAGAGSGKTTVLVSRMVSMVKGGMDISKICAITFTKAAASEFYERFGKALAESDSPLAKQALQNIDLCFMGTIDSFCNTVLSEHPSIAGIPSDAMNASAEERGRFIGKEYSKILSGEYGKELSDKGRAFSYAFYNAREVFTRTVLKLNDTKNLTYTVPSVEDRKVDGSEEKKRIMKYLLILHDHPEYLDKGKGSKDSRKAAETLDQDFWILNRSWERNSGAVLAVLKDLENLRIDPNCIEYLGVGYGDCIEAKESRGKIAYYKVKDNAFRTPLQEYRYALAMDLCTMAAPKIAAVMRKEGILSFDDYLVYLRDILKEDAASGGTLIRHIRERHHYFLIDEFQDTNPIQAEIFFYLSAKEVKENWEDCIPEKGTLFIVGDPKQSIYRFRNADVSSFLRIRNMFKREVGEVLSLTRNFRSTDALCTYFNDVFTGLLPEDTADQSRFLKIPVGEKQPYKATFNGVYKYHVEDQRSAKNTEDPKKAAALIRKIRHNEELTIQDRDRNGIASLPRPVEYSDFMVITPKKRGSLQSYMKAFYEAGIPFRVEGEVSFSRCPALKALRLLLAVINDPEDPNAAYALRHQSSLLIGKEEQEYYRTLSEALSPSALMEKLIEEADIYRKAGTDNAEYLRYAMELMRSYETDGTVGSLKDALKVLSDLIDSPNDIERCPQFTDTQDRVHLANLHKVKGLEAAIVILGWPFESKKQDPESYSDYSKEKPAAVLFSVTDETMPNRKFIETKSYPKEMERENEILEAEKIRLLYVAATRAANVLIISTREGSESKSYLDPWLPLAVKTHEDIFDFLDQFPDPPIEEKEEYIEEEETLYTPEKSLPSTYTQRRPSEHREQILSEEEKEEEEAKRVFSNGRKDATLIGTLVHRVMEILVLSKNGISEDDLVSFVMKENHTEEYGGLLHSFIQKIRSGGYPQLNSVPEDILKELLSAEEVHPELPFTYRKGDEIWNGIMDVVYKKDGSWHIVDYKTNADPGDLDERYKEQLAAYTDAFKELTSEEADALIYHIDV